MQDLEAPEILRAYRYAGAIYGRGRVSSMWPPIVLRIENHSSQRHQQWDFTQRQLYTTNGASAWGTQRGEKESGNLAQTCVLG